MLDGMGDADPMDALSGKDAQSLLEIDADGPKEYQPTLDESRAAGY